MSKGIEKMYGETLEERPWYKKLFKSDLQVAYEENIRLHQENINQVKEEEKKLVRSFSSRKKNRS